MRYDSYPRFMKSYLYDHFKKAHFIKFSQKHFVVGDAVNNKASFRLEKRVKGEEKGEEEPSEAKAEEKREC